MEDLHERVGRGGDVEVQIHEIVDLDIAQWTKAGSTLFHTTGLHGNLKALIQLIGKVIILKNWFHDTNGSRPERNFENVCFIGDQ